MQKAEPNSNNSRIYDLVILALFTGTTITYLLAQFDVIASKRLWQILILDGVTFLTLPIIYFKSRK